MPGALCYFFWSQGYCHWESKAFTPGGLNSVPGAHWKGIERRDEEAELEGPEERASWRNSMYAWSPLRAVRFLLSHSLKHTEQSGADATRIDEWGRTSGQTQISPPSPRSLPQCISPCWSLASCFLQTSLVILLSRPPALSLPTHINTLCCLDLLLNLKLHWTSNLEAF